MIWRRRPATRTSLPLAFPDFLRRGRIPYRPRRFGARSSMPMHGDVLCFSHLRWGFVYQRPNHLMARWSRDRRVFFIEEPTFDAASSPRLDMNVVAPRLHVVVPRLPPGTTEREAELMQGQLMESLVAQERVSHPLRWFYT